MKKVKQHAGCIGQELVAIQKEEPPAPKCQCKKMIEYSEANDLVKRGAAKWVVTKRSRGTVEINCSFCLQWTDLEKKSCARCNGTGLTTENKIWEEFNNDIVLMSSTPIDKGKYRMNTRAKTPRVATIEKKHILRAVVDQLQYAMERIEEYGELIVENLAALGAELRHRITREVVVQGRPEPEGRDTDYGRPVLHLWQLETVLSVPRQTEQGIVQPPPHPIDYEKVPEAFYKVDWWKQASPFAEAWPDVEDDEEIVLDENDEEVEAIYE